jgi:hypothetical protein
VTDYQGNYRRSHPDYVKRQRKLEKARAAAAAELAKRYPEEFSAIYDRIKKERNL